MNCPQCNSLMILRNSRFGKFYGCIKFPTCKETHGAHPDGKPLGFPAVKETRKLRTFAHELLGRIWGDWKTIGKKQKRRMYAWLKENTAMGHISMMMKDDLEELISKLEEELKLDESIYKAELLND